jgi:hypothetical protein
MSLALRHGLTGEVVLNIKGGDSLLTGWEIKAHLATHLGLLTPYQIILCINSTEQGVLSPFQTIQQQYMKSGIEMEFVIRPLQELTAVHYESVIEAIYLKNPTTLSTLLGQGLDLSPTFLCGGRTNAMLALAMLRDHDHDGYVAPNKVPNIRYPSSSACLTHLVLQARADPNIVPPKQNPTSMLGLP